MRRRLFLLLLVPLVLAACGTGSRESALIGTWTGSVELGASQIANPMAMALGGQIKPKLSLNADRTFGLTIFVLQLDGSWSLKQDRVVLEVRNANGQPIGQIKNRSRGRMGLGAAGLGEHIELSISPDSQTLTLTPPSGSNSPIGSMVLKKQT